MDLTSNHITNKGAGLIFDAVAKNICISCLILSSTATGFCKNYFSKHALEKCQIALEKNKNLTILDLNGNCIGNNGLAYIVKGLRKGSSLVSLSLSQTGLDDGCLPSVLRIASQSKIHTLDISRNKLQNEV